MPFDTEWLSNQFTDLRDIELLGSGGQRWTFTCAHTEHGSCVLKVVKPGREGRIDRELEAVSRIPQVPNVPTLHDAGSFESPIGPLVWILEERIRGETLEAHLEVGALTGPQVLSLARDLLDVALASEEVGIVHRDIKPENIIIDESGKAWLLDFGITRILDMESRTRSDASMGPHSPGYGAPEQFRNRKEEIDSRADLFGIGVVLYEASSGINPFTEGAQDRGEVLDRVETMELPRLELEWDSDSRFGQLVLALTQKYPYRRPRSCRAAKDWLNEIVQGTEAS